MVWEERFGIASEPGGKEAEAVWEEGKVEEDILAGAAQVVEGSNV